MEVTKKVYVHYDGKPEYTHVAKITWGLTAEQLAEEFTLVYNAKHGRIVSLDPATIHLLNGRHRMSKSANLSRLVRDRSDIFVEREFVESSADSVQYVQKNLPCNDEENNRKQQVGSPTETLVTKELAPGNSDQQQESDSEAELVAALKRIQRVGQELEIDVIRRALVAAIKAQQSKKYKHAGNTFSKILDFLPKQKICLRGLGSMALVLQKYSEALQWLLRGVEQYPLDAIFHARLGDAYLGLGKYKEALSEYERASGLTVEQKPSEIGIMESLASSEQTMDFELQEDPLEKHEHDLHLVENPSAGDVLGALTLDGLKISRATVLGKMGEGELANDILMKILIRNTENFDALYQCGIIRLGLGLVKEATKIFLKLLVSKPGDESVRSSLSKAIKHSQGMEFLREEVAVAPAAAPALTFLASCVKDYGAIDEAAELYNLAIELSPSSIGYSLNLIHLYEVMFEYLKALGLAVSLFQSHPSFSLSNLQFSDVMPYFEGPNWTESPDNISQQCQYLGLKFQARAEFLRWLDELPADKHVDRAELGSDSRSKSREARTKEDSCTYNDQQLDGLAILFTVTKILFVGGALARAKQLARLIEPARAASSKPLHHTIIRNEAAYFASVHQILEQHPVPLPLPPLKDQQPLYLAGDSHCMSAAWRTIRLRGQRRLLVPMLVTGLKVWHLRPESEFYPKYAFENVMQSVADGAQLVMVYGEIDCRESILVSVEKGIYKNVEDGVEVIVNVYLEVLQQLIFNRGFELFVHPVPPVLNETRAVVHIFNRILKKRLESIKEKSAAGKRLHWLDFVPDLLTTEGFLKDEFKLDGTHLSPKYWSLLQRELQKANRGVEHKGF